MKLILYTGPIKELGKALGKNLGKLIQEQLPQIQIEAIDSAEGLSRLLCRPLNRISVIIIFVNCEEDLRGFLTLEPLFDNIRRILVLPERTTAMMAMGLQLNPSFISYWDSEFLDIISVLKKIYHRHEEIGQWHAGIEKGQDRKILKFKDE